MHPCTIFVFVIPLSSVVVIIITSRGLTGGHKRGYWPAVATGNCPVSESQPREALTPNIAALSLYTRASIFFFQVLTEAMNWLVTQTFCCQHTEYLRRYIQFSKRGKSLAWAHTHDMRASLGGWDQVLVITRALRVLEFRLELGIFCPTRTQLGPNTTRTE